jgi:subtilase family serine protease
MALLKSRPAYFPPTTVAAFTVFVTLLLAMPVHPLLAQTANQSRASSSAPASRLPRLTQVQLESMPRISLSGNTRPEATPENDLGPVDDNLPLGHLLLQLQRPPGKQDSLDRYLDSLSDQASSNYHRWLTPAEFGQRFGPSIEDIADLTAWLTAYGLQVHSIYPSRMLIDFSGTAAQVRAAFRTEIHAYSLNGQRHIANNRDPEIPLAFSSLVAGIVSLHDFRPFSQRTIRKQFTASTGFGTVYPVTPQDLAVIYNLSPLFKAGYTGKGETIAVIADSDVYSSNDWTLFRSAFGLSTYTTGAFKEIHPAPASGSDNCKDPGVINGRDQEPILDAEYASASAPGATVEVASCADTPSTSGALLSLANVINNASLRPSILSISYGACEAANGAAANAAISSAYEQAAAEGISVFAAAGDAGSAFCDVGATAASHGIGVNAYASTAYNVAVGGTDFSDTYSGTTADYWNATNSSTGDSAKSYIPEAPWDDSCASPLIAEWNGYSVSYGALGFCLADYLGDASYQTTAAGGGGPSGCATGTPSLLFIVDGACRGWAKPSWQTVPGNPKDSLRDLPDVALFSADGIWSHFYLYCNSNVADEDGVPCKSTSDADWSEGGGTSFATPIMAGVQALIDQKWGPQGNPNPVYYKLATTQFNSSTLKSACLASEGASSNSSCIFHDIATAASTVNCEGIYDCFSDVLSTSVVSFTPAFNATAAWDFATGLGSINAYNLVMSSAW